MRYRRFLALVLGAVVAGACSTGASSSASGSPSANPAASAPASANAARVEINLTDALKMEPEALRVPVGQAVTFVVTNAGSNNHEFYVGDEAAQTAHETEMSSMAGMGQDEANGIALKPGETKELTVTFDTTGTMIAGCHEPGHYAGGMKATVEIGS